MKNSNEQIKRILEDLYAIDPGLKAHEPALLRLIAELLEARPDTKFDADVARQLKARLAARADMLSGERKSSTVHNMDFMKRLNIIFGGVAVTAVAVAALVMVNREGGPTVPFQVKDTEVFSSKQQIRNISSNAFGNLALISTNGASGRGGAGGGGGNAALGMGGDPAVDTKLAAPAPAASEGMGGDARIMPAYSVYRYEYKGEDLNLSDEQVSVYRRVKGLPQGVTPDQVLRSMNFGLLDMGKFSGTTVDSITLTQERDWGYNFYINFREGTMSLSENWWRWPTPDKQCRDEACYQASRITLEQVPGDSEAIALANQFLADHNISTEGYGQPFVHNAWREEYLRAADKSQFYIPDIVSVVYPLVINGEEVYDESGSKTGLSVNINVRAKRVSGLYELTNQQYESSLYAAETNADRLLKLAQQGGFRQGWHNVVPEAFPGQVKTITLELGTPTKSMVKFWMQNEIGQGGSLSVPGLNNELLVPALVFPVTKAPAGEQYYPKSVVIPLVKEVLDSGSNPVDGGPIRIMQ